MKTNPTSIRLAIVAVLCIAFISGCSDKPKV